MQHAAVIAYSRESQNGNLQVTNTLAVRSAFKEKSYESIVITDARLPYETDNRSQREALTRNQAVQRVLAGTDTDTFVIQTAAELKACVAPNDENQPTIQEHHWHKKRRVPIIIIRGHGVQYEPEME